MRRARTMVLVGAVGFAPGCGGSAAGPASGPAAPLTAAEWKTLPVEQKYTGETLERLKAGDPKLDTPEGWAAFQKTVVAPARRKDFPGKTR